MRIKNLILGAAIVLLSELAASPPAFEVASIRPQPWTNEGGVDAVPESVASGVFGTQYR